MRVAGEEWWWRGLDDADSNYVGLGWYWGRGWGGWALATMLVWWTDWWADTGTLDAACRGGHVVVG